MKQKREKGLSLKWGVSSIVVLCWVIPIAIIVTVAGFLLKNNYEEELRRTLDVETTHAMQQLELRLEAALESSKAVSYEGDVWKAYQQYQNDGDRVELYRRVTEYMGRSYSRDENIQAAFIEFSDQPGREYAYVKDKGTTSLSISEHYRNRARPPAMVIAGSMDAGIVFMDIDQQIYMVRNLLDREFQPYAVLTMLCATELLARPLEGISNLTSAAIRVDDLEIDLTRRLCEKNAGRKRGPEISVEYTVDAGGHPLTFTGCAAGEALWGAIPGLRWTIMLLLLLILPLLGLVIYLFYIHVNHPLETLVGASSRVQSGERGYQIREMPHNREFRNLTDHFNSMSTELKTQFNQIYLEQQALQESRIRALQSQINPHFLGNTLEIINWEARMAGNDKVAAMIEALSTMLDAAIGRDGRSRISLSEELTYVDAYLYIIRERMGEGLHITKEIDSSLLECLIPRLLLQPMVENAVEHDLSRTKGGELCIRAHSKGERLHIEVEHEGHLTAEDLEKIQSILAEPEEEEPIRRRVGLRNLNQRVRLIYGDEGKVSIEEIVPGRIISWVDIPMKFVKKSDK